MHPTSRQATLLACALLGARAVPVRADDATVKTVTAEEFAAEKNPEKHYTFEVAWPDGLTDGNGMHIQAADELAYLNENKLDATEYILLVLTDQSPPVGRLAPEVNPLGRYGFKKIVFKQKDGNAPSTVTKEYHPPLSATAIAAIPTPAVEARTVRAGEPYPDLSARPPELRPGALPPRLHYTFAPDFAVVDASARITAHLLSVPLLGSPPLCADQVEVRPGAWAKLREADGWAEHASVRSIAVDAGSDKPLSLEGRLVTDPADLARLEEKLRNLVTRGGGGAIHAPSFAELARWGRFGNFTLAEPTLLLQTTDQAHDFVFIFVNGRVAAVDDLKGLPDLP